MKRSQREERVSVNREKVMFCDAFSVSIQPLLMLLTGTQLIEMARESEGWGGAVLFTLKVKSVLISCLTF